MKCTDTLERQRKKHLFRSPCESVEGRWYNQLGSELILSKGKDGKLIGEFRTAVEKYEGAAGRTQAVVKGISSKDPSSHVVGFSAIFNEGKSATTWAGQCQKCEGGEEELHTTWILRGQIDTCLDHWKAVLINEDVFRRQPSAPGPRKDLGQNTPKRSGFQDTEETIITNNDYNIGNELRGKWYTNDGLQLEITEVTNGTINGKLNIGDSKEIEISGNVNEHNSNGVFAMSGIRQDKNTLDVWVGQHHQCAGGKEILEMSSLQLQGATSCENAKIPVGFRKMPFTRVSPTMNSNESSWIGFTRKISNFFSSLSGK